MGQRNEIYILCCCNRPQKYEGQNRPSGIRLSGVPPIMPIKTKNKYKQRVKIDPQKYVLQGSPLPSTMCKNS